MAKKKKMTLEEKLEEAIVSDVPYQVPGNWCWVHLEDISSVISKGTTPKGGKSAYIDSGVKFLRVENIDDCGYINTDYIKYVCEELHLNFLKRSILVENDILISIAGTLGKTAMVRKKDLPLNTNQAIAFIRLLDIKKILPQYVKLFLSNPETTKELLSQTKVTAIPNLTLEIIGKCRMPLPPLKEQQRIVDRIESLFEKLDKAKELIEEAREGFEKRKAAILEKAFTGKLLCNNVRNYVIKDFITTQYGYTESASADEIGPKFLRITDIKDDFVDWNSVPYCKINDADKEKYLLYKDDIVIARTGATTGKSYIIRENVDAVFASYLIRVRLKDKQILPEYLNLFLKSNLYWKQIVELRNGTAQPGVNAQKLKQLVIPIPTIEDQKIIVKILYKFLEEESKIEELTQLEDQIELLKKSILAKAFRGELGTNCEEDENALELLKEILSKS